MLGFYAGKLPAVEINNTFYRLPKASVLANWAEQVTEDFRFAIKASRRITHFKRLAGTEDETGFLLESCQALGPRLGALLFQLPPNLPLDAERLRAFLALLPEDTPAAFELRHPSWQVPEIDALLAKRGCTRVTSDTDEDESPPQLCEAASWGYLRLRRSGYDRAALASWAQRIAAQAWQRALVFFKHEDAGTGPALAAQFLEISGRAQDRKPAAARAQPSDRARTRKRG
jgi:uncharacterized protein YecE (DUF72 family)